MLSGKSFLQKNRQEVVFSCNAIWISKELRKVCFLD